MRFDLFSERSGPIHPVSPRARKPLSFWSLSITLSIAVSMHMPAGAGTDYECTDCNVILVSIDTLRADHLGCYGYPKPTSPAIDRFSKDSVLFRTAIAHAPSTEPSHASMFTSLIPAHHGALRAKALPISPDAVTLAEILKRAGFRTVSYNGGGQVSADYDFDRGFDAYESSSGSFDEKVNLATSWIEAHPDQRFFLFLHTYEVHAPYAPEKKYLDLFETAYEGNLPDRTDPGLLIRINDGRLSIDEADLQHIVNTYDAGIRSVDDAFGRLIGFLNKKALLDKTIVVLTSDHGEEFGEHGQVGRHSHTLYDELLKVPLILKLPRGVFASTIIDRQVRGIDLLPTLLDILGLEGHAQFQGRSVMPLLSHEPDEERVAVSQMDSTHLKPPTAIRTESEKLIIGSQRLVEHPSHQWFTFRAKIRSDSQELMIPIESFHEARDIRILVDGANLRSQRIAPKKQTIRVGFRTPGERTVAVESLTPCTDPRDVGLKLDLPCVSFRIFNPYEYFRLKDDPGEQNNLFDESKYKQDVLSLEAQLSKVLSSRKSAAVANEPVEIDQKTRERLKALGYID